MGAGMTSSLHFEERVEVQFSTERETREELQQIAGDKSLTLSRLISQIVDAYLKEQSKCTGLL